jgi:hypothetical protein
MPSIFPEITPRRRTVVRDDFIQEVLPPGLGDVRRRITSSSFIRSILPQGIGDWRGDIASMIASDELDKLISAVRKLNDQLIDAITARNGIYSGYMVAKRNLTAARASFGDDFVSGPMGITIPNMDTIDAQIAYGTAVKAVRVFARQTQTLAELQIVFMRIQTALAAVGDTNDADAVAGTLSQMNRFQTETNSMFRGTVPEYQEAVNQLITSFNGELQSWGVSANAYDDPRWLAAFLKAADKVVPIPGRPELPQQALDAGLGIIPVIAWVIVGVVGVITAGFVLSSMLSKLIPDQNSKAETARQIALAAQQRKAQEEARLRAQGASQATIDAAKASIDEDTHRQIQDIPEPGSPFGFLIIPGAVAAAGLIALKATGLL